MKNKKWIYTLSGFLVLASLLASGAVYANDRNGDDGDKEAKKEMKALRPADASLFVQITEKGKVNVHGAKVTSVSGSTVNASTTWGASSLNWQLNVNSDTKMSRKSGGKSALPEIAVGHLINFQGNLVTTSSSGLSVNATHIKDFSIEKISVRTSIEGTVQSIAGAAIPTSMVVRSGDRNFTVNISSETSLVNKLWLKTSLDSLKVGDKVRVYGTVNIESLLVNASIIRDLTK